MKTKEEIATAKKEHLRKYYIKYKDSRRASEKRWRKKHPEKAKEIRRLWNKKNPEKVREMERRWRKANPEKNSAQRATRYAIKTGKIVRPTLCSFCSIVCKPHAHHRDYAKPLDVRWLCCKCHMLIHRMRKMA